MALNEIKIGDNIAHKSVIIHNVTLASFISAKLQIEDECTIIIVSLENGCIIW